MNLLIGGPSYWETLRKSKETYRQKQTFNFYRQYGQLENQLMLQDIKIIEYVEWLKWH